MSLEEGQVDDLKVKDLMTKNVISLPMEKSVADIAVEMAKKDISAMLLKSEDKIVGILTDRDIIKKVIAQGLNPKNVRAGEVMNSPLISISENVSVQEAAEKMRDNKIRRLVVKNKGKVVGIISESDIVRVEPELHFIIREYSRLGLGKVSPLEPRGVVLEGYCEDCENYSEDLKKVNGKWLCEECREHK
jgi:signal-transduction protein with cAMP-binding, CBS, and nucleotidyltransferase domain